LNRSDSITVVVQQKIVIAVQTELDDIASLSDTKEILNDSPGNLLAQLEPTTEEQPGISRIVVCLVPHALINNDSPGTSLRTSRIRVPGQRRVLPIGEHILI